MRTPGLCRPRAVAMVLALTLALVVAGCEPTDPDTIPAVPTSGTVSYKGKPVQDGAIELLPEKGHLAYGKIKNGKFTLSTYGEYDGAIPGKHKVAVRSSREVKLEGGDIGVEYFVPEEYASQASSGLSVTIPPGGSKNLRIEVPE